MQTVHDALLKWYSLEGRTLPWRAKGIQKPNPYHVWLSEIMLQQTTVSTVIPYFLSFIERWPTPNEMAKASLDEILHAWQGLGYYARARNLHRCAQIIQDSYKGEFPQDSKELIKLPGIGTYTSKAIASIAFEESVLPIDGNIERILARLNAIRTPLPEGNKEIENAATLYAPQTKAGDFAQAMMDLGSSICTPKNPSCTLCPLASYCKAYKVGIASSLPFKSKKMIRPQKYAIAYILERMDGAILLRRRPEKGLLGGMMGVPTSPWLLNLTQEDSINSHAPLALTWQPLNRKVSHSFTHFDLDVILCYGKVNLEHLDDLKGVWVKPTDFNQYAIPKLFKKILNECLNLMKPH